MLLDFPFSSLIQSPVLPCVLEEPGPGTRTRPVRPCCACCPYDAGCRAALVSFQSCLLKRRKHCVHAPVSARPFAVSFLRAGVASGVERILPASRPPVASVSRSAGDRRSVVFLRVHFGSPVCDRFFLGCCHPTAFWGPWFLGSRPSGCCPSRACDARPPSRLPSSWFSPTSSRAVMCSGVSLCVHRPSDR